MPSNDDWTRSALERQGFVGFVRFADLPSSDVPLAPGVYVVLRTASSPPDFVDIGSAGAFKGRTPSVPIERLAAKWVDATEVLYIGKATPGRGGRRGLRERLDEYRRIGAGEPAGHWGGRFVWQLADRGELLVAWRETEEDAGEVETMMLRDFVDLHGSLPFANLRR